MSDGQAQSQSGELIARIRCLSRPLQPQPSGYPARVAVVPDIRAIIVDIYGSLLISGSGDIGSASAEQSEQALHEALSAAGLPVALLGDDSCAAETLSLIHI